MAEIDAELVERVTRWCADAGRQAGAREIHAALAKLSWDELLHARALLADAPPARPLGPFALADMARGAPADLAAEREREGRYRVAAEEAEGAATATAAQAAATRAPSPRPRRASPRARKGAGVVIHRARDRSPPLVEPAPPLPALAELERPEGRAVLERLVRAHGGRRAEIARELSRRYRRADGTPAAGEELAALLEHHGLARAFERRERDELLHALRAEGGVRAAAAARVGLDAEGLSRALERLGARDAAERIRAERRSDLRARATLSERVHLLLAQEARLRDLELLAEFEADLRARLPEHLRALRGAGGPLEVALARSLSLPPGATAAIAARFGLELRGGAERLPTDVRGRPPALRGARAGPPRREREPGGRRPPRPGGGRAERAKGARGRPRPGTPRTPRGGR
jgi:hypothetical protein